MDEFLRGVFQKVMRGARAATNGLDALIDRVEEIGSGALDALDRVDLEKILLGLLSSDTEEGKRAYEEWVRQLREEAERLRRERRCGRAAGGSTFSRFRAGDPYSILGIERGTAWPQIRAAYARRVKVLHPDKRPADLDERSRRRMDLELQQVYTAWEWFENNRQRFPQN